MSFALPTVLLAWLSLAGAPLSPPSPEEQRLFAEGLRAYEAGDARAAERAWKAGYAVARDPAFLVRIGEAQEKAGAPAEAVDSYRRYLREAPDAADRADIEHRLARLAPSVPAAPRAAPPDTGETPGQFGGGGAPAPPGASAPAAPAPAAPAPATALAAAPAAPAADRDGPPADGDEETGWNPYKATAWIATAAAITMLGTAGFFAASASSKSDDVNLLTNYRDERTEAPIEYATVAAKYESATKDGQRYDDYAKVALVGAAAAAAVAATFFVIDGMRAREVRVALSPAAGGGAVAAGAAATLVWTF